MKKAQLKLILLIIMLLYVVCTRANEKKPIKIDAKKVTRVYKNKNYRVIKALSFYTPLNAIKNA